MFALQEAAAELSALISRAQHLMGKMDSSQTAAFSSVFGGSGAVGSPLTPASQRGDSLQMPPLRRLGAHGGGGGGGGSALTPVEEARPSPHHARRCRNAQTAAQRLCCLRTGADR